MKNFHFSFCPKTKFDQTAYIKVLLSAKESLADACPFMESTRPCCDLIQL